MIEVLPHAALTPHNRLAAAAQKYGERWREAIPETLRMDNQWHIPFIPFARYHTQTQTTGTGPTYLLDIVIRHQTLRFILLV